MASNNYPIKIGFTRHEFNAIFQLYSQNVYAGFFKDFSFTEDEGRFYISFREEAGKIPFITIEKKKISPRLILRLKNKLQIENTKCSLEEATENYKLAMKEYKKTERPKQKMERQISRQISRRNCGKK